ncbi:uncharacterized protein PG986_001878 [Apiospora aurea]|uniref:SET domain-containing protein n=1 Tax=Apiospora aurea TaxID=335848 RepID=A0ABR1QY31_9PEZI
MTTLGELLNWAKVEGLVLNGIQPASIKGCGTGVVACRQLEVMPIRAIRSITTTPLSILRQIPSDTPLHGILAAELALEDSSTPTPWRNSLPTMADIIPPLPFMWCEELQMLLPTPARLLLEKQQAKYHREWSVISRAIPSINEERFLYYWHIVNTRAFLYQVRETERYRWEDRLALVPVADMFNHADDDGCRVSYMPEHYAVTTDRAYERGEELFISYGDHSNDFLLAEYGFLLAHNHWDVVSIDDAIMVRLDEPAKEALRQKDLLGTYTLHVEKGPCSRVQAALRLLCCPYEHWLQYVEGRDDGHSSQLAVNVLLCELLGEFEKVIQKKLHILEKSHVGATDQRDILKQRWRQMNATTRQMAKRKPHLDIQDMESELGYKISTYSNDEGPRFYSDLRLVPRSDYERCEREYQQLMNIRRLKPSVVPEKQLISRLPTHGTTKRIERTGDFNFGLNIPLLFTEAETTRTVLVSDLSVDVTDIQTPGLFELPPELRLKIYKFAIPRGQWCIDNLEDFEQDILPRCLGDPSGYYFPLSKGISLLLASKRLRQEALPIVFRRTAFHLDDMDDLAKLLVAVGHIGRANIESLHFPWESRSDIECRWEMFPEAEDNHLKLPTLHVSTCMQLLHQCARLRQIRVLFDEELVRNIRTDEFTANEGIQSLCSKQGLQQVELLGLGGEIIEDCPMIQWLEEKITSSRRGERHGENTD